MDSNPSAALGWITPAGVALLLADASLVAFTARRLARAIGAEARHPVVRGLALLLVFGLLVIGSGFVLGAGRQLGGAGFLCLHAVLAAAAWLLLPPPERPGRPRPRLSAVFYLSGGGRRRLLLAASGWLITALLVYAVVLAVGTFPGTRDSQTYRLTRVGYWLQERRLALDFAGDTRLLFMPVHTELFMTWLTGFFPRGYPLVGLAQCFGGGLCLLSAGEFGRLAGLSRPARLAAAGLLLGLPNLLLEFSTSQSDLFTAGLLNAGLVFLWRSFRTGRRSDRLLAGIGLGLALGSKGTVLYWAPGLSIWTAGLLWRHRGKFRENLGSLAVAGAIVALLGGWKYADNWVRFRNPFAPPEEIARIHLHGGPERAPAAVFIAGLHFWQLFQPNSNPRFLSPWLRPVQRRLGDVVEARAPDESLRRSFQSIRGAYAADLVYEDIVSFGLLAPLLAAIGLAAAAVRRGPADGLLLGLGASLGVYFAFFFTQQLPNAWNYRFFVMLGPFLAVLAASALPRRSEARGAALAVFLVVAFQVGGAFDLQSRNILGGWRALRHGEQSGTRRLFESLAAQAENLPPAVRSVAVALPMDDWVAPYFRLSGRRRFRLVSWDRLADRFGSAAEFLRASGCDALITRPDIFSKAGEAGTERRPNDLRGDFARVCYVRSGP